MSRVFFRTELECVATFWRIMRKDGVATGLTSHDRDLFFDGFHHLGSPGIVPSAIRRTAGLTSDSAEVQGALTHDGIGAADLSSGRFDGAEVAIGLVDWETSDSAILYRGVIGEVADEAGTFQAELRSAKAILEADAVPRTSPTCRAQFCGPGCSLSATRFTHEAALVATDHEKSRLRFEGPSDPKVFENGSLRWIDGPHAGQTMEVMIVENGWLFVDAVVEDGLATGTRVILREGCDHTFTTCRDRFRNAANFRGEPFLPGNDFVARYPQAT